MKQKPSHYRFQGFLTGVFSAALILGLGGAALAATHSIQINDGIKVTINGAYFTPRDAGGQEVPLFTYNGTTYAPIRALCEAAGMRVDYDSGTRTAQITTGDRVLATDPNAASYIAVEKAKEIALAHAGVQPADAVFVQARLDREDGRVCYDLEFYSGSIEYDYDIDAVTGAILDFDHDMDHYSIQTGGQTPAVTPSSAPSSAPAPSAGAQITEAKAREIAQARAPGAQIVKCSLDRDHGQLVYEIELQEGRTEYECEISAASGEVLKWEVDYDD